MIFLTKITDFENKFQVLVEAQSYTEAEALSQQVMKVISSDSGNIESITKTAFKEILLIDDEKINKNVDLIHFKAKVLQKTISDSGKPKNIKINLVIQEINFEKASEVLKKFADGFIDDAKPFGLEETEILDFYDAISVSEMMMKKTLENFEENGITVNRSLISPFI